MINDPVAISFYQPAGISIPTVVEKRWGQELTFCNGENLNTEDKQGYCMKEIQIDPDQTGSLHFHINKAESLYVVAGQLTLGYADGKGSVGSVVLGPGQCFTVPPGFQHRLTAGPQRVILLEASTPDDPNDSIRVSL